MSKYMYRLLLLCLVVLGLIISYYAGMKSSFFRSNEEVKVDLVLEKVKKVFKLITVEGHFAEVYDYKEYYKWDIAPLRKKALIRINAKVAVGYDFEKLKIITDDASKTITIQNFPPPEILSIDHNLDYYDITQGTFNTFTNEDYNSMNDEAKKFVASKAKNSVLIQSAEEQKEELISMLQDILHGAGWKLEVNNIQHLD